MDRPHVATAVLTGPEAADFVRLAEEAFETVSAFEEDDGRRWRLDLFFQGLPDHGQLEARLALLAAAAGCPAPRVEAVAPVPAVDWVAATRAAFPPIPAGRFVIQGSHLAPVATAGRIGLTIDATAAFGTGEHPTTRLMLDEIDRLAGQGPRWRRVLDLGCGSGILGIAAIKRRHPTRLIAGDIDAASIRVARVHARLNGVAPTLRCVVAAGLRHPLIRREGPYDLILANILAGPLIDLAGDLAAALAPGGRVVLAGLMAHQARGVLGAARARGLVLTEQRDLGVWRVLSLRQPLRKRRSSRLS